MPENLVAAVSGEDYLRVLYKLEREQHWRYWMWGGITLLNIWGAITAQSTDGRWWGTAAAAVCAGMSWGAHNTWKKTRMLRILVARALLDPPPVSEKTA